MIKKTYRLRSQGFSMIVGIPSEFCRALRMDVGSEFKITLEDERIIITPVYDKETAEMIKHDREFDLTQAQMFEPKEQSKETSHEKTVTSQESK